MLKKRNYTLFLILISLIIGSCNNINTLEETSKIETKDTSNHEMPQQEHLILPSPMQIAAIFKKSGVEFLPSILNKPSEATKYYSKESKTLNLGIYSADMFYCVLHNKNNEALKYIECILRLYEDIGLSSIFEVKPTIERFEKNMNNRDSIIRISANIYEEANLQFQQNGNINIATALFTGAWIEGLYIASTMLEQTQYNTKLMNRTIEQFFILDKLILQLEKNTERTDLLNSVILKLKLVNEKYNTLVNQNKLDEDNLPNISQTNLKLLLNDITAIRSMIIS